MDRYDDIRTTVSMGRDVSVVENVGVNDGDDDDDDEEDEDEEDVEGKGGEGDASRGAGVGGSRRGWSMEKK